MRIALFVFLIGAAVGGTVNSVTSASSPAQQSTADVPYLIGRGQCVAIEEGRDVNTGTHLLAIAPAREPVDVTVEELNPWTEPSHGRLRRPRTDWTS